MDVTDHLNSLKIMLQVRSKVVTHYYDDIRAFKSDLSLWEMQLPNNIRALFPCLRDLCNAVSAEQRGW